MAIRKVGVVESEFLKQVEDFFEYHADGNEGIGLVILAHDKSTKESGAFVAGKNHILSSLIYDMLTNEDMEDAVHLAISLYAKNKLSKITKQF